jgi:acetylornithine deacetylase/succinyl-diaminopimelate desuccinylase-like protein
MITLQIIKRQNPHPAIKKIYPLIRAKSLLSPKNGNKGSSLKYTIINPQIPNINEPKTKNNVVAGEATGKIAVNPQHRHTVAKQIATNFFTPSLFTRVFI